MAERKSKPKSAKPSNPDRHKEGKQVRIKAQLAGPGQILADKLAQDLTQVVNDALRERLVREGLWPAVRDCPGHSGSREESSPEDNG